MRLSHNFKLIEQAIREKKQVLATYDGKPRHLCPHVLGWNRDGFEQCLFYQFAGGSLTGLSSVRAYNWRCMKVEEMSNIRLVDGEWHTAGNHSQEQTCVSDIHIEVSY